MFRLGKYNILGINQRNVDCILEHNDRQYFPNADSKLITKRLAESAGVQVPKLLHVIEHPHQLKSLGEQLRHYKTFVIKPDHGSGGSGIVVIKDVLPIGFQKGSGDVMKLPDLVFHCQNILSGMYALGGQPDRILIETTVQFDPVFDEIAYQGVPDIRLIVLKGKPLMGMLRLPTKQSDGKANLHKGGVGVGIDMERGVTTTAVQMNHYITYHPETGKALGGRPIPYWKEMLDIAIRMQRASQLGYVGVDIVIDKQLGPMVLEINARPGLAIQIANKRGLADLVKAQG